MPYKTGKMKGELTTPEIRKLIRAHNVLVSIKIPKGSKREDIIALVKKNGYEVNHEKQALVPKVEMKRKPKVDMKSADKVLPKPKTKEEKAAAKKSRDMKKKEKDDKIKAEGVKQGAALQRVISKRKVKKVEPKKEEPKKETKADDKVSPNVKEGVPNVKDLKNVIKDRSTIKKGDIIRGFGADSRDSEYFDKRVTGMVQTIYKKTIKIRFEGGVTLIDAPFELIKKKANN